jgi:hypothetical protein
MDTPPTLAGAMAAAQAEMKDPTRNKTANVPNRPVRHYAGLDDLLEAVRPVFARHGIAITQPVEYREGRPFLVSRLLHGPSAQSLESAWELTAKGSAQDRGSELTYARRYTLEGLVGAAATEDDDGAAGSGVQQDTAPRKRATPAKKEEPAPPTVGESNGHHPSWTKAASAAFCADLGRIGMDYKVVATLAEEMGEPRPSQADPSGRAACLRFCHSAEGRTAYAAKVPGWAPPVPGAK